MRHEQVLQSQNTKVTITIEGKPNQLYSQGMRSFEQYDEARKYFAEGRLANEVQAELQLHDVSVGEYLVNKYALWLNFRKIDENELTRNGQANRKYIRGGSPYRLRRKQKQLGLSRLTST